MRCAQAKNNKQKVEFIQEAKIYRLHFKDGFFKKFFSAFIKGRHHDVTEVFLLREADIPVAICVVIDQVIQVYVDPIFRGLGLGKKLVSYANRKMQKPLAHVQDPATSNFWNCIGVQHWIGTRSLFDFVDLEIPNFNKLRNPKIPGLKRF